MSEEQKEGIVVHPHFDKAAEPGNAAGSSEGTSGDQASQESLPESEDSSQSNQTAATDTSASDESQQSNEGQAPGNDVSGASIATGALDTSAQGSDGAAPGNDPGSSTPPVSGAADGTTSQPVISTPPASQVTQPPVGTPVLIVPSVTPPSTIQGGTVISNAPTPTPAPSPAPTPAPVSVPSAPNFIQTGINEVDQVVETLMKDAGTDAKIVINTIKEYILGMKPGKPLTVKQGTTYQVSLYNALLTAINKIEGKDFRPLMQSILALLHAHREGAFRETHVFRFVEHVPLSAEHRRGFQKITTLLKTLAKPETRQELLRQMNFDPLLENGLTERGRTKLAAFFGK